MLSLVYLSSATTHFSDDGLTELLQLSRVNNARLNITGMLLYNDGNFIQVLEGPDDAVRKLYNKIARDPRHSGLTTVIQDIIQTRNFPNWSMGFKRVDKLSTDLPGFSNFFADTSLAEAFRRNPQRATTFLLTFRDLGD